MNRNLTFQSKRAQNRIKALLDVLKDGPLPATTIAECIFCHRSLVTTYTGYLMKEPRQVRIVAYEVISKSKNGVVVPIYGLGSEPDVELRRQTNNEKWERVKSDPKKREARRIKQCEKRIRDREALGPDAIKRDRRRYDPPLIEQVHAMVEKRPGYTIGELAYRLDANERAVYLVVKKLRASGVLQRAKNGTAKKFQWETPENPFVAHVAKATKPQSIFAALGL